MTKEEAKQILFNEAACWQVNAAKHYETARYFREQYLNGCMSNTWLYEKEMEMGRTFQDQAMLILTALI